MPTYVYACPECGVRDTVEHSIKENPRLICGVCSLDTRARSNCEMQRIIQPSTFILQGSGWAKDGYK